MIGTQEFRLVIYAPRKHEVAPWILGPSVWLGCEKVLHMWYPHTWEN